MRLGFQRPSPFERIPNWRYGDDDWAVTIRKRGNLWTYSSLMARAYFGQDRPAEPFVDHPGEIAVFARLHIALGAELEGISLLRMGSADVARKLGECESDAA